MVLLLIISSEHRMAKLMLITDSFMLTKIIQIELSKKRSIIGMSEMLRKQQSAEFVGLVDCEGAAERSPTDVGGVGGGVENFGEF